MRVAIATDNGYVSQHFGRCKTYTIVELENGTCTSQETLENPGHEPGVLPELLHKHGVSVIVTGGMGRRAQALFDQYGISQITGTEGEIPDVIDCLLKDTLRSNGNTCSPQHLGEGHGEHHNGEHSHSHSHH